MPFMSSESQTGLGRESRLLNAWKTHGVYDVGPASMLGVEVLTVMTSTVRRFGVKGLNKTQKSYVRDSRCSGSYHPKPQTCRNSGAGLLV